MGGRRRGSLTGTEDRGSGVTVKADLRVTARSGQERWASV